MSACEKKENNNIKEIRAAHTYCFPCDQVHCYFMASVVYAISASTHIYLYACKKLFWFCTSMYGHVFFLHYQPSWFSQLIKHWFPLHSFFSHKYHFVLYIRMRTDTDNSAYLLIFRFFFKSAQCYCIRNQEMKTCIVFFWKMFYEI